jgi:hypothetical protein
MTEKECKDCICLIAGKNKELICDELQKNIKYIAECPEKDKDKEIFPETKEFEKQQ